MTPDERKSLKREAKKIIDARSVAWARVLHEANPAALGSDLWMENHLRAHENELWLRNSRPDWIPSAEIKKRFALITSEETGTPEPYAECKTCGDVLYSVPTAKVSCSCGRVILSYERKRMKLIVKGAVRSVRLIPKGVK